MVVTVVGTSDVCFCVCVCVCESGKRASRLCSRGGARRPSEVAAAVEEEDDDVVVFSLGGRRRGTMVGAAPPTAFGLRRSHIPWLICLALGVLQSRHLQVPGYLVQVLSRLPVP